MTIPSDVYYLNTILNDVPEAVDSVEYRPKIRLEDGEKTIREWLRSASEGKSCYLLLCYTLVMKSGEPVLMTETVIGIGRISNMRWMTYHDDLDTEEDSGETPDPDKQYTAPKLLLDADIFLFVHVPYQRQGFGKAAFDALIDAAFERWGALSVEMLTWVGNEALRKTAWRLDFRTSSQLDGVSMKSPACISCSGAAGSVKNSSDRKHQNNPRSDTSIVDMATIKVVQDLIAISAWNMDRMRAVGGGGLNSV